LDEIEGIAVEAAISSIHRIEKPLGSSHMTKKKQKAKQIVPIDAYRKSRANGVVRLTTQNHLGQLCANFVWKDWSALVAPLKTEMSEIDRAILALTKLSMGRQPFLNQSRRT